MQHKYIPTVLWSPDHNQRIEVRPIEHPLRVIAETHDEMVNDGCNFWSSDPDVCGMFTIWDAQFSEELFALRRELKAALYEALRCGNHVFFMNHDSGARESFGFREDFTSASRVFHDCVGGVVIVDREAWRAAHAGLPVSKYLVLSWLQEKARRIESALNGELFEFLFADDVSGESFASQPFSSEEEAWEAAMEWCPECRFTDEDFEETQYFRLGLLSA